MGRTQCDAGARVPRRELILNSVFSRARHPQAFSIEMSYDHTVHMSYLGRSGTVLDPPSTPVPTLARTHDTQRSIQSLWIYYWNLLPLPLPDDDAGGVPAIHGDAKPLSYLRGESG